MLDLSFTWDSLVKGDKMMAAIQSKIGTDLIEDLPIKFTAVAADIAAEKEHWFQSGPIDQAIRASVSLPLFFTPHTVDGVQLIDGGILNPTPIEPTLGRRHGPDHSGGPWRPHDEGSDTRTRRRPKALGSRKWTTSLNP